MASSPPASSKRSPRPATSSKHTFRAPRATSTSSRTRSTSARSDVPSSVLIALGSNLGDRALFLRRAISHLSHVIHVVRVSSFIETNPVDAPPTKYLHAVVAGYTALTPAALLEALHEIEARLGRRRSTRNAPRVIDLDLILHSANLIRTRTLTVPHPRYLAREFVLVPLRELKLDWRDPATGKALIFTTVPSITSTDKSVCAT